MVKLRRVFNLSLYSESKKDLEDLKEFLGDDLYNDYMNIRDRITDPNFRDFSKLKKMDKNDIKDFVSNFQSKRGKKKSDKSSGAQKLYEDSDWVVYKITSYPAAKYYGSNTTWCITGRYEGHEERGEEYFNDYIKDRNLDGGYYFYISKKDPKEKYCVLQTKDKKIDSVWDAEDTDRGSSLSEVDVDLPEVKEVNMPKYDIELLCDYIRDGKVDKVKKILQLGVSDIDEKNSWDSSPLYVACEEGEPEIVKLLIENGADVNFPVYRKGEVYYTPLIISSAYGYDDIVKLLVDNGADPNISGYDKDFPLHFASGKNYVDIVDLLIKGGANVNVKNIEEATPLHKAARTNSVATIQQLLKHGADIDAITDIGYTALCEACTANKKDAVRVLLEAGADPNIPVDNGETPLHKAVKNNNKEIIELLLKHGADINKEDGDEYTPLKYAKFLGYNTLAAFLEKQGAKE